MISRPAVETTTPPPAPNDDDDDLVCPLCTETMMIPSQPADREKTTGPRIQQQQCPLMAIVQRDCCQKKVCQSCLYRHVHSILEEGIAGGGAGRSTLTCPLGCGREMTDTSVRACFYRQHVHHGGAAFWVNLLGPYIVYPLCLLWIILFPFRCCHENMNGNRDDSYDEAEDDNDYFVVLRHKYWIYCHSTRAELADVRQYERWSLAVALRNMQRQAANGSVPVVMHCPSPNCTYAWLVANSAYRESKIANERRRVYLWYTPPKLEESSDDDWCRPEFLNMSRAYRRSNTTTTTGDPDWLSTENGDGRYMCCAKCHVSFCGLCRQPWRFGSKRHVGISCRAYQRQLPAAIQQQQENNVDAFAFASSGNSNNNDNGRCCPGCSMLTSRTGGCNHMTCPCGVEWCYVCERPWNTLHYGCVNPPANNGVATIAGCIIS